MSFIFINLQTIKQTLNQLTRSNSIYLTLNTYFKIISFLNNNNLQSLNILITSNKFNFLLIINSY